MTSKMLYRLGRARSVRTVRLLVFAATVALLLIGSGAVQPSGVLAQLGQSGPIVFNLPNLESSVGGTDVWLIDPSGTGETRIPVTGRATFGTTQATLASVSRPVWSRDGKQIAGVGLLAGAGPCPFPPLCRVFPGLEGAGGYALVVFDPQLQTPVRAVAPIGTVIEGLSTVAFSPRGEKLAYTVGSPGVTDFWVINVDGTGKTCLGTTLLIGVLDEPSGIDWSPVRDDLLVVSFKPNDLSGKQLSLIKPEHGGLFRGQQLTRFPPPVAFASTGVFVTRDARYPVFSRTGDRVAFVAQWEIQYVFGFAPPYRAAQIRIVNTNGTGETAVPNALFVGEMVLGLSWSADGSLVFDRSTPFPLPKSKGIWTINVDGTGLNQIANAGTEAFLPSWRWQSSQITVPPPGSLLPLEFTDWTKQPGGEVCFAQ